MPKNPPVVYVLHGEDEYAITQFVAAITARLGDPALANLNTTRLDGRSASFEELETAVRTLPFMVKRRVVIITNPLARVSAPSSRERLIKLLEITPPEVAVLLIEYRSLTSEQDRKRGKLHWLEEWAQGAADLVDVRAFPLPQGVEGMASRIQEISRRHGGQITPPAASILASLIGEDPRAAEQEILKLMAYVNYSRPVEPDDVEHLTADQGHGDVFALVDAIGQGDGRRALDMLHRLLSEQDPLSIFGMVVRQFRILLLVREVLDGEGQMQGVAKLLRLHPFVLEKSAQQARRFTSQSLEMIYHRLLDLDTGIKNGEIEGGLALDTLIAGITRH